MRIWLCAGAFSALVALSCGGPQPHDTGTQVEDATGVHQCKVSKSVERPMLVEWPATEKAALHTNAKSSIVVVRYDGCRLKMLEKCKLDGSYTFDETPRSKDGFSIKDKSELFTKLPLGAVSLEGQISQGNTLSLSYVAVGTRTAQVNEVTADKLSGSCEGATHYVRSMIVGAYELSSEKVVGGSAGVEVGSAGAGGSHEKHSHVLRYDGDLVTCEDRTTTASDAGCQAIVQLVLEPLDEAIVLFHSGEFDKARELYLAKRQAAAGDSERLAYSKMIILCLEKMIEKQNAENPGSIRNSPPEITSDGGGPASVTMPPLIAELLEEKKHYISNYSGLEDVSALRFGVAYLYYLYGNWAEARERFKRIYHGYCNTSPYSTKSWKVLLNMAAAEGDIDERERLALLQKEKGCSSPQPVASEGDTLLDTLLADVAMQRTLERLDECLKSGNTETCLEAGVQLVQAVGRVPHHPSAGAALYNAGLAFEKAGQKEDAIEAYKRCVKEYPGSEASVRAKKRLESF